MAQSSLALPRISLSRQLANFTNSTAGLDLTLRFFHSLALLGTQLKFSNATVLKCSVAASQIGLGRRYLRFFCFLDCFHNVQDTLAGHPMTRKSVMELAKSSCLGIYLALEGTTMLHDMDVLLVSWYTPILLEAYKFWFYAICIAIVGTVSDLFLGPSEPSTQNGSVGDKEKPGAASHSPPNLTPSTGVLLNRLVIDTLDLTIPGSLLGWIPVSTTGVATAMLISTILVWPTAWAEANF
ncbi:uncharacterized protein N7515_001929 [Penicillium bovifimosum]|uniref:Uncharacterized protein n=1 Tax=Penicillium bovifimosum TaxID=126998 RepID=A0A9W9HAM3_9EURO|nr:uncharacterized protein N7515_001929 [Penicillium bovifimosum]KAJ5143142.1 hypothetical protein N7515_001929 [Penicillium bovifimosum]